MITWPVAIVLLGITAALCFMAWLRSKDEMEKEHHVFQGRAFGLEERKFEVWKTAQLAHTAQQGGEARKVVARAMSGMVPPEMVPNPGKVVSMRERMEKRTALHGSLSSLSDDETETPTPERLHEIAQILTKAKDMPEDEARAFLAQHGIEDVAFFRQDDA